MQRRNRKLKIVILLFIVAALIAFAILLSRFLGRELEKRTYRLDYAEDIDLYAKEFDLDPYLVAAVIHTESSNRMEAVSESGACGLMQIMPQTGDWIAGKLEQVDYEQEDLFIPTVNIRMGCWYLRFLLDRYETDTVLTLAAYNAGQGTVDKWLEDPAVASGNTLFAIPYPETDKYIKKVLRAYEKYIELYKDVF